MITTSARRDDATTRLVAAATAVLAILASGRLAAQDVPPLPQPYRPTTAFPVAIGLTLASGRYGDRAVQPQPGSGDSITYKLTGGLALGGKVQLPVTRRLGLVGSASITRRNRRAERGGLPSAQREDKVTVTRFEGGLGFRFRPHAPVFFAGAFVYNLISPGPVEFQDANVAEAGGGFGIGYDFGRSAERPVYGRVELWNYWVKPSAVGLAVGYEARSLAHDLTIAVSVMYRPSLRRRAAEPARPGGGAAPER